MRIGYACKLIGVSDSNFKTCTMKNATSEVIEKLIKHNLQSFDHIIDYNIEMGILLFRISSDLIPFASSPINTVDWSNLFQEDFIELGRKIKEAHMRVSMHPGQYTVINSPSEDVVNRSIKDLEYHCKVLDAMLLGREHKLVLHIGGAYQDKESAINRFKISYNRLPDNIKARLVIENDDKLYHIEEVLRIGTEINCPVVFDNLHHEINPSQLDKPIKYWMEKSSETWTKEDGHQKTHYSQQDINKKRGGHSATIELDKFLSYYQDICRSDLDIMLEVKDKNLSAVKCINAVRNDKTIKHLELEWSRYKNSVLEKDASDYLKIRALLKNKNEFPVEQFYHLVDTSLQKPQTAGNSLNALLHVWGYFKNIVDETEKNKFLIDVAKLKVDKLSLAAIKRNLLLLAKKYNQHYLLDSYYFDI